MGLEANISKEEPIDEKEIAKKMNIYVLEYLGNCLGITNLRRNGNIFEADIYHTLPPECINLGNVGKICYDSTKRKIVSHTERQEIRENAKKLSDYRKR